VTDLAQDLPGPLLKLSGLKRHFDLSPPWISRVLQNKPRQILRAVDGVSFQIDRGKTFSLVGESGCGKSTIAKCVVGLQGLSGGTICFDGQEVANAESNKSMQPVRQRLQMIFQDPYASLNPRWKVGSIVAEPIKAFGQINGREAISERIGELLKSVGLTPDDAEKYPHEFSGGQRQRISIARVLASNADFIVCDEPTSALDVSVQAQILNLMTDLQEQFKLTYLLITHDLSVVRHMSDRIGVMYLGRLVEVRDGEALFEKPSHPYTRMLLDTIPRLDVIGQDSAPMGGEVPSPLAPPSGCPFHPRCPFAKNRCREIRPDLIEIAGGEVACHAVEEGRI